MKKKILFFSNGLYGGGAENVLQTILKYLDRNKFELFLYSIHKEDLNDLYPKDITYHYIFDHVSSDAFWYIRLYNKVENKFKLLIYEYLSPFWFYRFFVKGTYDIEVAFIEGYATRIVSGSQNPHSKKIAWVHIDMQQNHWTNIAYRNQKEEINSYSLFDIVVGVSQSVKCVCELMFPSIKKACVLYNPIDEKQIQLKSIEEIEGKYLLKNKFRFISIGRLVDQKGYDRLLPIVYQLKLEGLDVELWILGEGKERALLEKYIVEHHLENNVRLLGFKSNPYSYLKHCDAFVSSSRSEGYSTVITEALILGLPVVATCCAGMEELLGKNSEYGLLIENEENALYEGMKSFLLPNIYIDYKQKAIRRSENFNLKNLMDELCSVL